IRLGVRGDRRVPRPSDRCGAGLGRLRNRHRILRIEETPMTVKNAVVRRLHDQRSLGFGGAPIGNLYRSIDDETATAAVTEAWDQGIRYFEDRKSTRLNSSHVSISYAVFC